MSGDPWMPRSLATSKSGSLEIVYFILLGSGLICLRRLRGTFGLFTGQRQLDAVEPPDQVGPLPPRQERVERPSAGGPRHHRQGVGRVGAALEENPLAQQVLPRRLAVTPHRRPLAPALA